MSALNEFLHHLHDTLILLGGDRRIAELLNNPELIAAQDVNDLRRYTAELLDATKSKLAGVNTLTVSPVSAGPASRR